MSSPDHMRLFRDLHQEILTMPSVNSEGLLSEQIPLVYAADIFFHPDRKDFVHSEAVGVVLPEANGIPLITTSRRKMVYKVDGGFAVPELLPLEFLVSYGPGSSQVVWHPSETPAEISVDETVESYLQMISAAVKAARDPDNQVMRVYR